MNNVVTTWTFMYESTDMRVPLYSMPHFSFTITDCAWNTELNLITCFGNEKLQTTFPVSALRNGFGFTMAAMRKIDKGSSEQCNG
jgi:hypothetical protein